MFCVHLGIQSHSIFKSAYEMESLRARHSLKGHCYPVWRSKTSVCVKELSRKAEEEKCSRASVEKGHVSSEVEELIV